MTERYAFGVVVLTMGRRPVDLQLGLSSLLAQQGVDLDIVVVGNGWEPTGLPDGVRTVGLADNEGIPTGRNAGVDHVRGDLLFFLDDDARLRDLDTLERIGRMFAQRADLGMVQPRVLDPFGRPSPRRWTPRLRVGDPGRSSDVTALWEGAVAIRRSVFEQVGGWPNEFFYMHEGIDLAWGVWGAGARVRYAGDIVALHPAVAKDRHASYNRMSARNRVFLARRRLPASLAVVYLTVWTVLTLARTRDRTALTQSWRGVLEGIRDDAGPRRPIPWRAIWRMTLAGRPPLV